MQDIIYSQDLHADILRFTRNQYDQVFLITDETVATHCLPLLPPIEHLIILPPGDANKDYTSAVRAWQALQTGGATRHSLVINLGGGMITDLGGFVAATFKRGMAFVNIPTTLLAMVDAAVGGKTGINLGALKNEVGVFQPAHSVIIHTPFLRSLDAQNIRSGYAEMLKHALLAETHTWTRHLQFPLRDPDLTELQEMIADNIRIKQDIVSQDPKENGLRKALNLGHTVGHALETLALRKSQPGLHGEFVAWGLVAELYLSCLHTGFPADKMRQTVQFIRENYGQPMLQCADYDTILELMQHDKKNHAGRINMTLLRDIGQLHLDFHPTPADIRTALDFLREG